MDEKIKQEAIEKLEEAKGFILISDDGKKTHFFCDGGERLTLNETIGLLELYKHKLIANYEKGE